ncbi:hypothetical protein BJX96DRAFT_146972 [Aspergillus floccosus]
MVGSVGWACGRVFPVYLSRLLSLFSLHPFFIPAVRKNKLAWLGRAWVHVYCCVCICFLWLIEGWLGWARVLTYSTNT